MAGRVRAVDHFKQSKTPADREALVKALTAEKFYGVQQEIARALADSGGDVCRDALLEGMKQTDARVRRTCVDGLGKFAKDAKVAAALKDFIKKGDESYAVEAAALGDDRRHAGRGRHLRGVDVDSVGIADLGAVFLIPELRLRLHPRCQIKQLDQLPGAEVCDPQQMLGHGCCVRHVQHSFS